MDARYADLAYERAIWAWLRRMLEEQHLAGGGSKKSPIVCDTLPYEMRTVPQEAIVKTVLRLEQQEHLISMSMSEYEFQRRAPSPIGELSPPPQEEANDGS